jgi:hypothetical protein
MGVKVKLKRDDGIALASSLKEACEWRANRVWKEATTMLPLSAARFRVLSLYLALFLISLLDSIGEPLTPSGGWPGYLRGWADSLEVVGSHVYIAANFGGMIIVDATDPANPVRIGGYRLFNSDQTHCVRVAGNLAFLTGYPKLRIVDISEPANPTLVGRYDDGEQTTGMAVSGGKVYLTSSDGFKVLDVSDPRFPRLLGSYSTIASDVQVVGTLAYLANGSSGLLILDVSDPAAPKKTGSFNTSGSANGVKVVGNLAYVAADLEGLEIIDVSNPTAPVRLSRYDTTGSARKVSVEGTIAVVADVQGVTVLDVTDPAAPVFVSAIITPDGRAFDVVLKNDIAYVGDDYGGLKIVTLAQPEIPVFLADYNISGNAHAVAIAGNIACIADQGAGLQFVDISNPSAPVRTGNYDPIEWVMDVAVKDNFAFVAANEGGIHVVDFSNPAAPVRVANYTTSSSVSHVIVDGDKAFVDAIFKIVILNISTPSSPYVIGTVTPVNTVRSIAVSGDTLYVAEPTNIGPLQGTFLEIFDVSVPSNPELKGSRTSTSGSPLALAAKDNLAFLTTMMTPNTTVEIIDVTNPSALKTLGWHGNTQFYQGVTASGKFLFLANDINGIEVLDIADPTSPKLLGARNVAGMARDIAIKGSVAYVAAYNGGLEIFTFADPAAFSLQLLKSSGGPNLLLTGQVGQQYQLDYRSNFGATESWSLLQSVTLTNTPQSLVDDSAGNAASRFYRMRTLN